MPATPATDSTKFDLSKILGELKISGQMPGEGLGIAITNAIAQGRDNMSQKNRDDWDALQIRIFKDTYSVWRRIWEDAGVLAKEPQ